MSLVPKFVTARYASTYAITTYDAPFKFVLSHDNIRNSFLNTFVGGNIISSTPLDTAMNPIDGFKKLRVFLSSDETTNIVRKLSEIPNSYVVCPAKSPYRKDKRATKFFSDVLESFGDLEKALPKPKYEGAVVCICELDNKDLALVEMQVVPQDLWDRRALAYVAAFYANQISKGEKWDAIKKVICVNILGGGRADEPHWCDKPHEYKRHYKFQDQLNPTNYIDGIELIQYSIMNTPKIVPDKAQQDWLTFFKNAYAMSEVDVAGQIITPEVLQAFEKVRLRDLPQDVMKAYQVQDKEFAIYADHTAGEIRRAVTAAEQEKKALAQKLAVVEQEKDAERVKAEQEKEALAAATKKAEQKAAALEQKLAEAEQKLAAQVEATPKKQNTVAAKSEQEARMEIDETKAK